MKRVFLSVIGFYWVTTVVVPFFYVLFFGYDISTFSTNEYQFKAALLMTFTLLLASVLIMMSGEKNERLAPTIKSPYKYMECVAAFHIFFILVLGGGIAGFVNAVWSGDVNGTVYSYASLFLEVTPLMFIKIFSENEKKCTAAIVIYIIYTLTNTSRAGIMYVALFYICARVASTKYATGNKKRDLYMGIGGMVAAPFAFIFASGARGFHFENIKILMDNIISRLSSIDLLGRAVCAYEKKDYIASLFQEKYSFIRQMELIVNSALPGDIFKPDVMPNQYFRTIFLDYSLEWSETNYMSINLTLPGYLMLKYSVIPAVLIGAFLIFLMYKLCAKYKNNNFFRVAAITGLWELLCFFDWNMIFVRLERIAFTVFLYYEYRQLKETGCIRLGRLRFIICGRKWRWYAGNKRHN